MSPSLIFQLITTIVSYSIMSNSKNCSLIEIEPDEKFISLRTNMLLFESDTKEVDNHNYTNFNIINESLRISSSIDE